jgi:copper(I)-binding protein
MKRLLLVLLAVVSLTACSTSSGTLTVNDAWARTASMGENAAAYFIIENGTKSDDMLLSASSDIAEATEIHMSMADSNGVMSMNMQEMVEIPAKGTIEFKTGGLHVMFINLNRDLKVGDSFSLILNFKNAGSMTIEIPVREY